MQLLPRTRRQLVLQLVLLLVLTTAAALLGYEVGRASWPFQPVPVAVLFGAFGFVVTLFVTGFLFHLMPLPQPPRQSPATRGERRH